MQAKPDYGPEERHVAFVVKNHVPRDGTRQIGDYGVGLADDSLRRTRPRAAMKD